MQSYNIAKRLRLAAAALLLAFSPAAVFEALAAGGREADALTLYSGRGEALVDPLIERFEEETGIKVNVRYGGTAELAVLLQEEGSRTPADLFWAQDAGALGALSTADRFRELPEDLYADLPAIYRSRTGSWVATSGRARVLVYSNERVEEGERPSSVFDLADERYAGRFGWAPTNGSFQAFVTAMRVVHGDDRTADWLEAMDEGGALRYRNNTALVEAIGAGEIDFAITNNYYLLRFLADDPDYPASQMFFEGGDIGNLVNVAGVAILAESDRREQAVEFVRFLLSRWSQEFFTGEIYEYPVLEGVEPNAQLETFETLLEASPELDLDAMEDLDGTLALLRELGLL